MNATQTQILEALQNSLHGATVADLKVATGKGETTIRKALKELAEQGEVRKSEDGPEWFVPQPEPTVTKVEGKKYNRHSTPTTRTKRVNQITKSEVAVRKTSEEAFPGIADKWYTVCLTHNVAEGYDTVLDAHYASTYPTFCPTCAPLLEGKVGRRRATQA